MLKRVRNALERIAEVYGPQGIPCDNYVEETGRCSLVGGACPHDGKELVVHAYSGVLDECEIV